MRHVEIIFVKKIVLFKNLVVFIAYITKHKPWHVDIFFVKIVIITKFGCFFYAHLRDIYESNLVVCFDIQSWKQNDNVISNE